MPQGKQEDPLEVAAPTRCHFVLVSRPSAFWQKSHSCDGQNNLGPESPLHRGRSQVVSPAPAASKDRPPPVWLTGPAASRGSEREVAQPCSSLCDLMDYSLPGSSVPGIFQARVLEWVAISFSRRSSQPRD